MASGLFLVEAGEIAALAGLASEARGILFEAERARSEAQEAKGLPPLSAASLPVHLVDRIFDDPIPGDQERQERLKDVQRLQNEALGRDGAAPDDSGFSPEFMRQVQQYQAGSGFGAFGAPVG